MDASACPQNRNLNNLYFSTLKPQNEPLRAFYGHLLYIACVSRFCALSAVSARNDVVMRIVSSYSLGFLKESKISGT